MKWRQYIVAIKKFYFDNGSLNASALTFYTMFAVVPILAASIGIARGFGLDKFLNTQIEKAFPGQESVIQFLTQYAANLLAQSSKEIIAGVAVVILFYSTYSMLSHIESAFNGIWQVTTPRKTLRRISNYLSLILIAPIILILSGSLKILIMKVLPEYNLLLLWMSNFISFTLVIFLFYWLYKYMPNTNVNPQAALFAGLHAGIAYFITQSILIQSQLFITGYNAVYGSLAALPIFLIWVQASWIIVLFGAQLCFVYQNNLQALWEVDLNNLSIETRQYLLVKITNACIAQLNLKQPPLSAKEIANEIHMPMCTTYQLINQLLESNILIKTTSHNNVTGYIPAQNVTLLEDVYILEATNKLGVSIPK